MFGPEKRPGEAATADDRDGREPPDLRLMKEYGPRYVEVQRLILRELPDERSRLAWTEHCGKTFHDLAAADPSFHELVVAEHPDIAEIRRRVEQAAAG